MDNAAKNTLPTGPVSARTAHPAFTPEPWFFAPFIGLSFGKGDRCLDISETTMEGRANRKLVAAAPALYAKLELIANLGGSRMTGADCREEALAALALVDSVSPKGESEVNHG